MPASEARILANRANALKSTGPKTPEGKAISRANSYKHGLTGAGVVMPEDDAAEVDRRSAAFEVDLKAEGEVGRALARRAALLSVRMERAFDQETAALSSRVRQARDEFEAPEGVDDREADRLRDEVGRIALFDPSKEACRARQYEAAAERGFFRCLKELREARKPDRLEASPVEQAARQALGSFLKAEKQVAGLASVAPRPAPARLESTSPAPSIGRVDVPFTIGLRP